MNSISHLDRFITRSLSPPPPSSSPSSSPSKSLLSSRSLPPSPARTNHATLPVRRRAASSSDTSARPRQLSPGSSSAVSLLGDDSLLSSEPQTMSAGGSRKRRAKGGARWLLVRFVAKLWQLVVSLLITLGMAGRSVKSRQLSGASARGRSARLSGKDELEGKSDVAADLAAADDDDALSVASSTTRDGDSSNGLSPPLMDPRTQAIDPRTQATPEEDEFDPRSQAIDPTTLPGYVAPPLRPALNLPSPSFEFSPPPPSPISPPPLVAPVPPKRTSRLLLLPNPLASASGNSLLHNAAPSSGDDASPNPPPTRRMMMTKTPFHKPKTLILDLDETLIHSTSRSSGIGGSGGRKGEGHMVEVFLGGRSTVYHVYKRPYVDYFLKKVSSWYTLVIFTASMQEYADPVIDWLDGGRGMFGKRLFRDSCVQHQNGAYIKDLSCLQEDLESIALIDNSPISYSFHQANGIPIDGWFSDPNDQALLDLLPVLDSLRFTGDVRHVLGLRGF